MSGLLDPWAARLTVASLEAMRVHILGFDQVQDLGGLSHLG